MERTAIEVGVSGLGVVINGKVVVTKHLRPDAVLAFFANLAPYVVGLEAPAGSHSSACEIVQFCHMVRLLRRCSGDLPEGRHTEAGYAVDHAAGDMSFNFPREQSPSPEAPSDQDLAPVRSFWHERTFSVLAGRLPTHLRVHCNAATESRSARPGISPDFRTSL